MIRSLILALVSSLVVLGPGTAAGLAEGRGSVVVVGVGTSVDVPVAAAAADVVGVPLQGTGGADAFERAAELAGAFPEGGDVVYVATAEEFADGLAVGPLAIQGGAPVLLVDDGVPAATAAALDALRPRSIVAVGGEEAIPQAVLDALAAHAPDVRRLAGPNRWATAAAIASRGWPDGAATAYLATGEDWPDALGAGASAGLVDSPLLLTRADELPAETAAALEALAPDEVVVVGGPAVIGDAVVDALAARTPSVRRLGGANRYATAAALATDTWADGAPAAFVVSGQAPTDALVAAPLAGRAAPSYAQTGATGGALLLTDEDRLPDETADALRTLLGVPAPTAGDVTATTTRGRSVTVELPVGSAFPTGDLVVTVEAQPDGGTLGVVGTTATFTPEGAFTGPATATYAVTDPRGGRATGQVTVTVEAPSGGGPPPAAAPPDVAISGGGQPIPDGAAADAATGTDFGDVPVGAIATRTFVIANAGDQALDVTGVTVPPGFTLAGGPSATVAGGQSTTFTLAHSPQARTTTAGVVQVTTSDPETPTSTFAVRADGIQGLAVTGGGPAIAPGDTTPDPADGTDLGNATAGTAETRTFTITNTTGYDIAIGEVATEPATVVQVVDGAARVLGAGGTDAVDVSFTDGAYGVHEARLSVGSSYAFTVRATVLEDGPAVRVLGVDGSTIAPGDTTPSTADGTDWGTVPRTAGQVERTYTVLNVGDEPLDYETLSIASGDGHRFRALTADFGTIPPGGSRTQGFAHLTDSTDPAEVDSAVIGLGFAGMPTYYSFWVQINRT